MAKVYKEQMIAILTQLGIPVPDALTMDQKQIERLVAAIETALDTSVAATGNAAVTDVLATKTFSNITAAGLTGTMPNNGKVTVVIDEVADVITIAAGYHDGTGTVALDSVEAAKIVAGNIKSGVTILGVLGTYTGA